MHSELTQTEDSSWSRSGSRIRWLRLNSTFKQRYHAGILGGEKKRNEHGHCDMIIYDKIKYVKSNFSLYYLG